MSFRFPEEKPSFWMRGKRTEISSAALGRLRSEVAIIGAGLTGLSIAFHIKSSFPHWTVAVFDREQIGSGSSGRAGGVIVNHDAIPGSWNDVAYLERFLVGYRIKCERRRRRDHPFQQLLNPYLL